MGNLISAGTFTAIFAFLAIDAKLHDDKESAKYWVSICFFVLIALTMGFLASLCLDGV